MSIVPGLDMHLLARQDPDDGESASLSSTDPSSTFFDSSAAGPSSSVSSTSSSSPIETQSESVSSTSSSATSSSDSSTASSSSLSSFSEPSTAVESSSEAPSTTSSEPSSSLSPSDTSTSSSSTFSEPSVSSTPATTSAESSGVLRISGVPSTITAPSTTFTTFSTPPASSTESISSSVTSPSNTAVAAVADSNGFWANKSAVAGTFSVVGLIAAAGLVFLSFCVARRVRRARNKALDEKFTEVSPFANPIEPAARGHSVSSSFSADIRQTPMEVPNNADFYYQNYNHGSHGNSGNGNIDYTDDAAFYSGSDESHQTHPALANAPTNVYLPAALADPVPPNASGTLSRNYSGWPSPAPTSNFAGVGAGPGARTTPSPPLAQSQPQATPSQVTLPSQQQQNRNPFLSASSIDVRDSAAYQHSVDSFYAPQ